jgi:hypothetical protein
MDAALQAPMHERRFLISAKGILPVRRSLIELHAGIASRRPRIVFAWPTHVPDCRIPVNPFENPDTGFRIFMRLRASEHN